MRRRSGALHSDSQEEFLKLAELSHERNGCFYDEAFNAELDRKLQSPESPPRRSSKATFMEGFDYQHPDRQKQEEVGELSSLNRTILVNLTLICNSQKDIPPLLATHCPGQSDPRSGTQECPLDLYIIRQGDLCLRVWTLLAGGMADPLFQTYLGRWRVLDVREGLPEDAFPQ